MSSGDRSNVYLESKPSDSSKEISKNLYYECQVIGKFCERTDSGEESSDAVVRLKIFWTIDSCAYGEGTSCVPITK